MAAIEGKRRIWAALADGAGLSIADLVKKVGMSDRVTRYVVAAMLDDNVIERKKVDGVVLHYRLEIDERKATAAGLVQPPRVASVWDLARL